MNLAASAPDSAPLHLIVRWDGQRVTGLAVDNRRPQAARLLVGRTVAEALVLVPRLFALCSHAQAAAAGLACGAALGRDGLAGEERLRMQRAIAAEAAAEHLWRLLLDWPALFGREPQRQRYADLHRRLRVLLAAGEARAAAEVLRVAAADLLPGLPRRPGEPLGLGALADAARAGGVLGPILAALLTETFRSAAMPVLLPPATAADWLRAWPFVVAPEGGAGGGALRWAGFCAAPVWRGRPAETGGLARHAGRPELRMLVDAGYLAAARLLARVVDLEDCARRLGGEAEPAEAAADAAAPVPGEGLGRVETARGVLLHRVRVEGERIADYAICAPTEWNFHSAGAFVREAAAMAGGRETLRLGLSTLALALDPCVRYKVVIEETVHA